MGKVAEVPLDFEHLALINDGRIDKLLRIMLARAAQDCIDRPNEKGKRKVMLEFEFEPEMNDDGECEKAKCQMQCRSKIPIHRSRKFEMRVGNKGFSYNQDFPDELDARRLPGFEDQDVG